MYRKFTFIRNKLLLPNINERLLGGYRVLQGAGMTVRCQQGRKPGRPRLNPAETKLTPEGQRIDSLEEIIEKEVSMMLLMKSKDYISSKPDRSVKFEEAKYDCFSLGLTQRNSPLRIVDRHPAIFRSFIDLKGNTRIGFTDFMEGLLQEEKAIMDSTEAARIATLRKLVMLCPSKKINLKLVHSWRHIFGFSLDMEDRVRKYPQYFEIEQKRSKKYLKLVEWDDSLAVPCFEDLLVQDIEKAKQIFVLPLIDSSDVAYLDVNPENKKLLYDFNSLPLISPYNIKINTRLDPFSIDETKYRVCLFHEFLSLTIEKKASVHHLVEVAEEPTSKKKIYHILKDQRQCFYLAGSRLHWQAFLKDCYDVEELIGEKDPLVVWKKKLFKYANYDLGDVRHNELFLTQKTKENERRDRSQSVRREMLNVMQW